MAITQLMVQHYHSRYNYGISRSITLDIHEVSCNILSKVIDKPTTNLNIGLKYRFLPKAATDLSWICKKTAIDTMTVGPIILTRENSFHRDLQLICDTLPIYVLRNSWCKYAFQEEADS